MKNSPGPTVPFLLTRPSLKSTALSYSWNQKKIVLISLRKLPTNKSVNFLKWNFELSRGKNEKSTWIRFLTEINKIWFSSIKFWIFKCKKCQMSKHIFGPQCICLVPNASLWTQNTKLFCAHCTSLVHTAHLWCTLNYYGAHFNYKIWINKTISYAHNSWCRKIEKMEK